jgi:hypothetical protein
VVKEPLAEQAQTILLAAVAAAAVQLLRVEVLRFQALQPVMAAQERQAA